MVAFHCLILISQIIKKTPVIIKAGISAFIFLKYLNLESHEAARGKEIVIISNIKYRLILLINKI